MRVLIIGCGYVGMPLGAELVKQGHEVFGLRRSLGAEAEFKWAGVKPLMADITKAEQLARLPAAYDWVVNCVSASGGGVAEYREVYLRGMRNLIEWLAATPLKKFVYTSSTSVYGQTDGSLVKESSPTEPAAETAKILVETERVLLEAARETTPRPFDALCALEPQGKGGPLTPALSPSEGERTPRPFDALCAPEPQGKGGPLTPALSPSEGERGNRRQLSGEPRFMGRETHHQSAGVAYPADRSVSRIGIRRSV
jgi:hypothetical protein